MTTTNESEAEHGALGDDPTDEMPLDKKAVFGWSMFDFANSSFTTVMVTAYFSIYFKEKIVPPGADGSTDFGASLWGWANGLSQLLVLLSAPIVGALADFSGAKKKYLFVTYIGCSLLTMALGFVHPGQVAFGFMLFVIANVFYSSGENIVGAFLPEIAPVRLMGKISGFSWGLGYIGGIGALIASLVILHPKVLGEDHGYPWVWVMIGAWFLISGVPTFLFVKERPSHEVMPPGQNMATVGFFRLYQTYKQIRAFRQLFRFLLIFVLIYTGLTAVIAFASIIAKDMLKFNTTELGKFLILTNLVAVAGAWTWGWLQDKIGSRWAIILSLIVWLIALALVLSIPATKDGEAVTAASRKLFWVAGCFVGIGLGATSSSCRALVGIFSPPERSGEFFGLWGFFGKFGSMVGPSVFALLLHLYGMRNAIIGLGFFFIASAILMWFIDEKEGRAAALRYTKVRSVVGE